MFECPFEAVRLDRAETTDGLSNGYKGRAFVEEQFRLPNAPC